MLERLKTRKRLAGIISCSRSLLVLGAMLALTPGAAAASSRALDAENHKDSATPSSELRTPDRGVIEGRYIVVYDRAAGRVGPETDGREEKLGFESDFRYRHALEGFAAELTDSDVRRLRDDPEVAVVSPDRRVEATSDVPLAALEEIPPTGTRRVLSATETTTHQRAGVGVAVIDTGIQLDHPDLNAVHGIDCIDPNTPASDGNGHGTHVAGTIAARNQGAGAVGVAPGTRVYAVRVLNDEGAGTFASVICGVDWVTAKHRALGIGVANVSLGGFGEPVEPCETTSDPLHLAFCNSTGAGVNHVAAAGNFGWDFDFAEVPEVPAAFPEVLTVTAVSDSDGGPGGSAGTASCWSGEVDDAAATWSNFALTEEGREHTIAAPGVCIRSTLPNSGYGIYTGTSMAAPHVAGVVALCLNRAGEDGPCEALTPAETIAHLRSDAEDFSNAHPDYGFLRDPLHSPDERYYGFLVRVGDSGPPPAPPQPPSPPANDDFAAAKNLGNGHTISAGGTNLAATKEPGEPDHVGLGGASVWYLWRAPSSGQATIDTCGSTLDTMIAAYTGTTFPDLRLEAGNDDNCGRGIETDWGAGSRIRFAVRRGETYRIAVDGFNWRDFVPEAEAWAAQGPFRLDISLREGRPPNDDFALAEDLGSAPSASATGSNVGATKQLGEPDHAGAPGGASVWYRWTAPASGRVRVDLCGSDWEVDRSSLLAAYTGKRVQDLTELASSDGPSGICDHPAIRFRVTAGETYRIAVDGWKVPREYPSWGSIRLGVSLRTGSPPPNDNFADAQELEGGSTAAMSGTNVFATKEPGELDHAGNPGGKSVWYRWSPRVSDRGRVEVDVCESEFITVLAVYEAGDGGLIEHDGAVWPECRVTFRAGTSLYWIAVDGDAFEPSEFEQSGEFRLKLLHRTRPPNDDRQAAADLGSAADVSVGGTNRYATKEEGEQDHAGNPGGASVWYRWRAPRTGPVTLDTCGSGFDTVLAVYRVQELSLSEQASNDDVGGESCPTTSRVRFGALAGASYLIAVDGWKGRTDVSQGEVRLNLALDPPPPNDDFASAQELSGGLPVDVSSTNVSASREQGEPTHAGLDGGSSVWYRWTPLASGIFTIDTCGSGFNTVLGVYTGSAVSALTGSASNNNAYRCGEGDIGSRVFLRATAGQTYWIAVDSASVEQGRIALHVGLDRPPNDDLAPQFDSSGHNAEPLGADGIVRQVLSASGTNARATKQPGEPDHAADPGGASVWYSWKPSTGGAVTIETCGSDFDTVLAVYTGSTSDGRTTKFDELVPLAANNDACGQQSRVTLPTQSGRTFYIAVDGSTSLGLNRPAPEGIIELHIRR